MSILTPPLAGTPDIMKSEPTAKQREDRDRIYAMALEDINPGDPDNFENESMYWKFERLRAEDPVHYTAADKSAYGAYWSVTSSWDALARKRLGGSRPAGRRNFSASRWIENTLR